MSEWKINADSNYRPQVRREEKGRMQIKYPGWAAPSSCPYSLILGMVS